MKPEFIGPYRLLGELGRGGMGVVYLAVRERGESKQKVAVKILKHEPGNEEAVTRFQNERQILADLSHPNIAGLYEGGTTNEGSCYIAMEYVDGEPIDRYCNGLKMPTKARLELFQKVCAAVHFAHQKLVAHQDLKPGNILVTREGEPKLLDFGIAGPLPSGPQGATKSSPMMTPAHASPEQIRGEPITTASDIYALGGLLYQLLTGHRPYRLQQNTEEEIRRAVVEQEPEKPSLIINRQALQHRKEGKSAVHTPESVSETRDGTLKKLRRALAGDVDHIVLKALRKEPCHRYTSVQALSEDIDRHLRGFPIFARKGTLHYRIAKIVRRHRFGVAALGVGLLAVMAFIALTINQQWILEREQENARHQWERAERVSQFLMTLFEGFESDRDGVDRGRVTARELLDKAASNLKWELIREPGARADLMETLGKIYLNLGMYDRAQDLLEKGFAIRGQNPKTSFLDLARSFFHLGNLYQQQGKWQEARSFYARALRMREQILGAEHPDVVSMMALVADDMRDQPALIERALSINRQTLGDRNPEVIRILNGMGLVNIYLARYDEAERCLDQAAALAEQALVAQHPYNAQILINRGILYKQRGQYDQAERHLLRALEIQEKTLGPQHSYVGFTLDLLAGTYAFQGEYDKAVATMQHALVLKEQVLGADSPWMAPTLHNFALIYTEMGSYEQAESLYLRALAILEREEGPEQAAISAPSQNLTGLYFRQGRYRHAEAHARRILAMLQKPTEPDMRSLAAIKNNLGVCCYRQHKYAEAERLFNEVLIIGERVHGAFHPSLAPTLTSLASVYRVQGKYERAGELYLRALGIIEERIRPDHPHVAKILNSMAALRRAQARYDEAAQLLDCSLAIQKRALKPTHPDLAATYHQLGMLFRDRERYGEAEALFKKALDIRERALPATHPDLAASLYQQARIHLAQGKIKQAELLCRQALDIRERAFRPAHPLIQATLELYAHLLFQAPEQREAGRNEMQH